jgi:NADPH-dependent curcumin reductase CurA
MINLKVTLAARPTGFPKESDFKLLEAQVPDLAEGQILVQTHYLSVDPYQRGRMNAGASYAPGLEIGDAMVGGVVGKVIQSRCPDLHEGDFVQGNLGWQTLPVANGDAVQKIDPDLASLPAFLYVLGMPGLTAYFGLLELADPQPGETVLVSGGAGAVGSIVGQIAQIRGCRVVGITGTDEKVAYLRDELRFDAAYNYKASGRHGAQIRRLCPDGIDVYFDNVGGAITDAAILRMNEHGRVTVCGQISQYNLEKPERGPRLLWQTIVKRLKIQGFLVFDFQDRFPAALARLAGWLKAGEITYREDIVDDIQNAPTAFIGMLKGNNIGKRLVRVR